MKKLFFGVFALASFVFVGCNKNSEIETPSMPQMPSSEKVTVTINLASPASKATIADTENEAKVHNIQLFVFNGDAVDGYSTTDISSAELKATVDATAGLRDIYAFVNAPDLSGYIDKRSLLAAVSNLSDNALNEFVMNGKLLAQNVAAGFNATVNVDRYASRIRLSKITRNFSNSSLAAADFKVRKIFLTGVTTNVIYDYSAPGAYEWINSAWANAGALSTDNAFVYFKPADAVGIAQSEAYDCMQSFYAYPNTNDGDSDEADVKNHATRLVIEAWVDVNGNHSQDDDEIFAYPVKMPALESNKSYEVMNLVLTKLGNKSDGDDVITDSEDQDIESVSCEFTIVVNDWEQVLVGEGGTFTI